MSDCFIHWEFGGSGTFNRNALGLLDEAWLEFLERRGPLSERTLLLAQSDFAGLAVLKTALDGLHATNFAFCTTAFLGAPAEGLTAAGQFAEAHVAIDAALERTERNDERWYMPELLRIKGEIIRSDGSADGDTAAEDYFQKALDWARRQKALSWELRAATSLARLWHRNGRTAEADELLSGVYDRFTEGFDTADLKFARGFIKELRGSLM
jgi:predicted ATPase